ncbi:MAG: hypothetical protein LBI72_10535 [Flavobacteriaceae bacterium]|jgi:hypothetical protein|nr:hypothetical protein [Flavobacteriaceae bacterium]
MDNSILKNSKRSKVFKVPEGYFDDLDSAVLQKINTSKHAPKTRRLTYTWYFTAAAVIAILLALPFVFKTEKAATISKDDIESYLEYNATYGVTSDVINSLDTEDFQEIEKTIPIKEKDVDEYVLTHIDLEYYYEN